MVNLLPASISIQLPIHSLHQNPVSYNHEIILALIRAVGGTTLQAVSHRFLNAETHVRSHDRAYKINGQSSTETGFSTNTSLVPCQYRSTKAQYSYFFHVPPMLYNLTY